MTGNEYQLLAARTINNDLTPEDKLEHAKCGMVSEIGELFAIYQKVYQGHNDDYNDIHKMKELGDLLWFIAEYCTAKKWTLEEVMQANIDKLVERYPEGFSEYRSLNRKEGDI